jgi:drug/metabolite transporter (DMT)-like permease
MKGLACQYSITAFHVRNYLQRNCIDAKRWAHWHHFKKGNLMNKALLIAVLMVFSALTAYTMVHYGGLIPWLLFYTRDPASWQIFADLLIAMCLLLVFLKRDADATSRPFWPWAIFSIVVGSFGPLLYFITARKKVKTQTTE